MLDNLNAVIYKTLESRKYQLQKQIIEALKANDNDLFSLLKSQWAHRFGVESLEELKNLDLIQEDEQTTAGDNQEIEKFEENAFESDKPLSIKNDDNQEKEIENQVIESVNDMNSQSFKIESYEKVDKENNEIKSIYPPNKITSQSEVQPLIPLPPKPKYSYLKKWLMKS